MTEETWDDVAARLAGRPDLHDAWLNGLACNRAATGSVLWRIATAGQRLRHSSFWLEIRELTQEAGPALARHPDRSIRLKLTVNPGLSLDALAVLARDPGRIVKTMALESIWQRDRALHRASAPGLHDPGTTGGTPPQPVPPGSLTRAGAQALAASPGGYARARAAWDKKWSFLVNRPNFTRNGMAADFPAGPSPRLRRAALYDPAASPELVGALSHDPDSAACPRAISDPRLPLTRLHEALGIPDTALAAARNPALPGAVMHKLPGYTGAGQAGPGEQGQAST